MSSVQMSFVKIQYIKFEPLHIDMSRTYVKNEIITLETRQVSVISKYKSIYSVEMTKRYYLMPRRILLIRPILITF